MAEAQRRSALGRLARTLSPGESNPVLDDTPVLTSLTQGLPLVNELLDDLLEGFALVRRGDGLLLRGPRCVVDGLLARGTWGKGPTVQVLLEQHLPEGVDRETLVETMLGLWEPQHPEMVSLLEAAVVARSVLIGS